MNFVLGASEIDGDLLHELEGHGVQLLNRTKLELYDIEFFDEDKVYIASERDLPELMTRTQSLKRKEQIEVLKDKFLFRVLTQNLLPEFSFEVASRAQELLKKSSNEVFIVKPRKGFFGLGVRRVSRETLLHCGSSLLDSLASEVRSKATDSLSSSFSFLSSDANPKGSDSSLADEFILEECVSGTEYSVDLYYNSVGKPVILNICCHPEHDLPQFSNALYYSSYSCFEKIYHQAMSFFVSLGERLNARSFPIHAEFMLTSGGRFVPIELNPLRFGGFGLSDLPYYAYGFNPIQAFFDDRIPDWEKIWSSRKDRYYGWVLKYNRQSDLDSYRPDHAGFKKNFSHVLKYREIDFKTHPVSGVAYVEEKSLQDLLKILKCDFNQF